MDDDIFVLDSCPESVWSQLPGHPEALDQSGGETWQSLCSATEDGRIWHVFGHNAHPLYGHRRIYAHVDDGDAGPWLSRLKADGQELPLPPVAGSQSGDLGEEVEDLADP